MTGKLDVSVVKGTSAEAEALIACLDVDYRSAGAVGAGVWFRGWQASTIEHQAVAFFSTVADYEPGNSISGIAVFAGGSRPRASSKCGRG